MALCNTSGTLPRTIPPVRSTRGQLWTRSVDRHLVVVLEVVDLYGCGSVFTNEIVIDVLPDLEEPSIELWNTDTLVGCKP